MRKISLKKILGILTCSIGFSASGAWGLNQVGGVYQIGSCEDLRDFSTLVNDGSTTANAKMTDSFDCTEGGEFLPIGSRNRQYKGTFDGDGFTISHLTITGTKASPTQQYVGLFGYTASGAVVKNLFIDGMTGYSHNTGNNLANAGFTGAIVGRNDGGTISNCSVKNVTLEGVPTDPTSASKETYSGGIAGYNSGVISNCSVTGTSSIIGAENAGGIVGNNATGGSVTNCLSSASVEIKRNVTFFSVSVGYPAGGIAGENNGSISNCVYTGDTVKRNGLFRTNGGAIVESGTACSDACYYTSDTSFGGEAGNATKATIEDIQSNFGSPWELVNGELTIVDPLAPTYFKVYFDFNYDNLKDSTIVQKNQLVPEPTTPTRTSYDFAGWYKESSFSTLWNFANDKVKNDVTIYAKWTSDTYTITYLPGENGSGDEVSDTKNYDENIILKNGIFTRACHTQDGWAAIDGGDKAYELGAQYVLNEDVILYPHWNINTHSVTYKGKDGNVIEFFNANCGSTVELIEAPEVNHFAFTAWVSDVTIEENKFTMPDADVVINLTYTDSLYTLAWNFNCNEECSVGSDPYTVNGDYKFETAVTAPDLTWSGYEFDGWNPEVSATMPGENVTYTAVWTKLHTVTFNTNDGSSIDAVIVRNGNVISAPISPTKTGFTFAGWFADAEFNTAWDFETIITEDITLFAKWVVKTKEITVVYGENDNFTLNIPVNFSESEIIETIETYVSENSIEVVKAEDEYYTYTFIKWEKQDEFNYVAVFDILTTKTKTVVAVYEVVKKDENDKIDLVTDSIEVSVLTTDNESVIFEKINAEIENQSIELDYSVDVYNKMFDRWNNAGENRYMAVYVENVQTTMANVDYGKGNYDIEMPLNITDENAFALINTTLEAENIVPSKDEDNDFSYEFSHWNREGFDFTAVFTNIPKNKEIKVVYTDDAADFFMLSVPLTLNEEEIIDAINTYVEVNSINVSRADDEYYTYEFIRWNKRNEDLYFADFDIATTKTRNVIALIYGGEKLDSIEVSVLTTDDIAEVRGKIFGEIQNRLIDLNYSDEYYDYTFEDFDRSGDTRYIAIYSEFLKTVVAIVDFGKIQLTMSMPANISDETALEWVNSLVYSNGNKIPGYDDDDDEYDYTLVDWERDGFTFTAIINKVPKTKEVLVVYGENKQFTVDVLVTDSEEEIINKIENMANKQNIHPEKVEDDVYTYEFSTWAKDEASENYIATFASIVKSKEVTVVYGSSENNNLKVKVLVTDTEEQIIEEIEYMFSKANIKEPTKAENDKYQFRFDGFEKGKEPDTYVVKFKEVAKAFKITYKMPDSGKLSKNVNVYTFGTETTLPKAVISKDSSWEFKGWYTEDAGKGSRYKVIGKEEYGDKTFYSFFQKNIKYEIKGETAELVVTYAENADKSIKNALDGVKPKNYEKDGKKYEFDSWKLEKGVYKAVFNKTTAIVQSVILHFNVAVNGRTLEISGAKIGSSIAVFDMHGRIVLKSIVTNGTQFVQLTESGSFVVRINNQSIRVNVK